MSDPVDKVTLRDLGSSYPALNFVFPDDPKPLFGNDKVAVTRAAADIVARIFHSLVDRGEDRNQAQRFVLQCVVATLEYD